MFSSFRTRCDPMMNSSPIRANGTKMHVLITSSSSEFLNADRVDILIRGIWEGSTNTIIDIRVTNLDTKSYKILSHMNDKRKRWK